MNTKEIHPGKLTQSRIAIHLNRGQNNTQTIPKTPSTRQNNPQAPRARQFNFPERSKTAAPGNWQSDQKASSLAARKSKHKRIFLPILVSSSHAVLSRDRITLYFIRSPPARTAVLLSPFPNDPKKKKKGWPYLARSVFVDARDIAFTSMRTDSRGTIAARAHFGTDVHE